MAESTSVANNHNVASTDHQDQASYEERQSWSQHDFTGIQAIGSGKFGKVFKAVERSTGVPCALKVVFK